MNQSILIVGRQPELGTAEAESVLGQQHTAPWGKQAVISDLPPAAIPFDRLGGSTRLCRVVGVIETRDWRAALAQLQPAILDLAAELPEGKVRIGLSYVGENVNARSLNAAGLELKKAIKGIGRSIRVVPNTAPELNTAQVLHNQLTGATGIELLFLPNGNHLLVARTVQVQDINAYAARDQKRPKRDARVGMLPPKLAQIIINLANGTVTADARANRLTLLDPFCGTGVVLQEALLDGFNAYGTDLEPRMIEYSDGNLAWLTERHTATGTYALEVGDATKHHWQPFDTIACETYLGRPLSSLPRPEKLSEIIADCDTIHRKFLHNLARQTKPGFRACIAVPAWKTPHGFKHLKTLDTLADLGYNRVRFAHVDTKGLIYHRPDQLVARELVVLERF